MTSGPLLNFQSLKPQTQSSYPIIWFDVHYIITKFLQNNQLYWKRAGQSIHIWSDFHCIPLISIAVILILGLLWLWWIKIFMWDTRILKSRVVMYHYWIVIIPLLVYTKRTSQLFAAHINLESTCEQIGFCVIGLLLV